MHEREALEKLISPCQKRLQKREPKGVLQIWVTNACDMSCFGCTQGSNLRLKPRFISLQHFEQACDSLSDYFGIVGVFGGNPTIHPKFEELCGILAKYVPYEQRGLWSNRLFGHGRICRETFNPTYSNINVHLSRSAYLEVREDWPEVNCDFGLYQDCRHSPPFVALQDQEELQSEGDRWDLIADCDINQNWSAIICEVRGVLKGYFCEIAGAQAMIHQDDPEWNSIPDLGVVVERGWWRRPMQDPEFAAQARFYCHRCGVPLRGYGELSQAIQGKEQVSPTHASVYRLRKQDREVEIVTSLRRLRTKNLKVTEYVQGGRK